MGLGHSRCQCYPRREHNHNLALGGKSKKTLSHVVMFVIVVTGVWDSRFCPLTVPSRVAKQWTRQQDTVFLNCSPALHNTEHERTELFLAMTCNAMDALPSWQQRNTVTSHFNLPPSVSSGKLFVNLNGDTAVSCSLTQMAIQRSAVR